VRSVFARSGKDPLEGNGDAKKRKRGGAREPTVEVGFVCR